MSRRWFVLRMVLWVGVMIWAAWNLFGPQDGVRAIARPKEGAAAASGSDPAEAWASFQAVLEAAKRDCALDPEKGWMRLKIGPSGLEEALVAGWANDGCLSPLVWGRTWPSLPTAIELEG